MSRVKKELNMQALEKEPQSEQKYLQAYIPKELDAEFRKELKLIKTNLKKGVIHAVKLFIATQRAARAKKD
jgi:hypothetical protein